MATKIRLLAAASIGAAVISTTACTHIGPGASNFQECPTATNGVACMSARQVYQATDDRDQLSSDDMPSKKRRKKSRKRSADAYSQAQYRPYRHAPTLPAVNGPIPVRTPSEVMRIRLNYWQSTDGNLHVPGYIYTEIEERRWQMGLKAPGRAPQLHPLQTITNPSNTNDGRSARNMQDEAAATIRSNG